MDCRHPLAFATVAGLLLAAGARAHAGDPAPPALNVQGGDFPALVMAWPADGIPAADSDDDPDTPACERVRARRLDELSPEWRTRATSVQLDCETATADDASEPVTALAARALLRPGSVRLAGFPVAEVRRMDSERWGDHQYVLDARYAEAADTLRQHVEAACRQRRLRSESGTDDCAMSAAGEGLFLPVDAIGGIWIHPDPDDAERTVYAEAWAD